MRKEIIILLLSVILLASIVCAQDQTNTTNAINKLVSSGKFKMSDLPANYDLSQVANLDKMIADPDFNRALLTADNIKNLDKLELEKIITQGKGPLIINGQDSQLLKTYASSGLGHGEFLNLKINRADTVVNLNSYTGKLEITYGRSGKIIIPRKGQGCDFCTVTSIETVDTPEKTIRIRSGIYRDTLLDLNKDFEVEATSSEISISPSVFGVRGNFIVKPTTNPADGPIRFSFDDKTKGLIMTAGNKKFKITEVMQSIVVADYNKGIFNFSISFDYQKPEANVKIGIEGQNQPDVIINSKNTSYFRYASGNGRKLYTSGKFGEGTKVWDPKNNVYVDVTSKSDAALLVDAKGKLNYKKGKGGIKVVNHPAPLLAAAVKKVTQDDPGLNPLVSAVRTPGKTLMQYQNEIRNLPSVSVVDFDPSSNIVTIKGVDYLPKKGETGVYVSQSGEMLYRNPAEISDIKLVSSEAYNNIVKIYCSKRDSMEATASWNKGLSLAE
jgi:hypothetical protein